MTDVRKSIDDAETSQKYGNFFHQKMLHIDHGEFVCGWGAAFINIAVTYPIYKIIFRQMLHGVKITSAIHQLRAEGIGFLYRGIFPPLAQRTLSLSLMFGFYDGTKRPLIEYGMNQYSAKILAGLAAGTVEAILMPFERIQTLLADSTYHKIFKNTGQAFRFIWINHGFREFYRGITPILLRNGPSNSMFFILREEATERLPVYKDQPVTQTIQEFTAGAVIGALTSSMFYPFNVIKVTMQCTMGEPKINTWTALCNVYNERDRKIRNVYKGCSVNCTRAFISWGIMNTAYEHLKKIYSQH